MKQVSTRNNDGSKIAVYGAACIVLYVYFIFEYVRPQTTLLPFLSYLKIPMLLTLVLFVFFLKSDKAILKDKLALYTGLFVGQVALSVLYAINNYHAYRGFLGMVIVLVGVVYVMPAICDNKRKLAMFVKVWLVIHLYLAVYSLTHAGHGPSGFLFDENDFALALCMTLPLPIYLSMSANISATKKWVLRSVSLILLIGVGFTMSRGGFLGIVTVFFMMWLLSSNRFATFMKVLLFVSIMGYPVYKIIPDSYKQEMSSITDQQESTRVQRIYFWGLGWDMFLDNPVLGVGANNYPWNVARYQMKRPNYHPDEVTLIGGRPAHSLYFTLLPELGSVGTALFFLILWQMFSKLRNIIKIGSRVAELNDYALIAKALIASVASYLVTGAFISVLYYQPFWYMVAFVLTLHVFFEREQRKLSTDINHEEESDAPDRNGRAGGGRDRFGRSGAVS